MNATQPTKPSTGEQETGEPYDRCEGNDCSKCDGANCTCSCHAPNAINEARQVAGHVEEAGEVCVPDCLACNDPVRAVIRDLKEARNEAFRRGRSIAELERERDALKEACKKALTCASLNSDVRALIRAALGESK